jgi:response regulator of citrate/malate metabolism
MKFECDQCHAEFQRPKSNRPCEHHFCSRACWLAFHGKDPKTRRTARSFGRQTTNARAIMEKRLGRTLTARERVHHLDGDFSNDAEDNLDLMSASAHNKTQRGRERDQQCAKVVAFLQPWKSVTTAGEAAMFLGVPVRTARNVMKDLVARGLAKRVGTSTNTTRPQAVYALTASGRFTKGSG